MSLLRLLRDEIYAPVGGGGGGGGLWAIQKGAFKKRMRKQDVAQLYCFS